MNKKPDILITSYLRDFSVDNLLDVIHILEECQKTYGAALGMEAIASFINELALEAFSKNDDSKALFYRELRNQIAQFSEKQLSHWRNTQGYRSEAHQWLKASFPEIDW